MHSQKIRTFFSCLLRGGTDLTGLGLQQESIRGSLAYLSLYHSYEIGKVHFCKWGTMETLNDSTGVTQEICGGKRKGNRIGLPQSPTCPLTSPLSPVPHCGFVRQGVVKAPACVAGFAGTPQTSPSHPV